MVCWAGDGGRDLRRLRHDAMGVPSPGREHSMKRMRPAEASLRIQLASRERFMMSCGSLSRNVDAARGLEEDASRGRSKLLADARDA